MPGLNVAARTARRRIPGGLLSVATVVDEPNRLVGGVVPDPAICAIPEVGSGWCFPTSSPPLEKESVGFSDFTSSDGQGDGFFTYLPVECFLNGGSLQGEAEEAFEQGEARAVEARVFLLLDDLATAEPAAASLTAAFAAAEQVAHDMPSGGIIHLSAATAVMLGSHIRYSGDFELHTRQGTPISNGLPAGTEGIYVSGPITLYRGERIVHEVPNVRLNTDLVLVERPWAAVVDCDVISIGVTP